MPDLTAERLRELLDYDPETGIFRWRVKLGSRANVGQIAGCTRKDGHIVIRVDRQLYLAHRLAWLYMTGEWPAEEIDHKRGNPSDNRWEKLREATRAQNTRNVRRHRDTASGLKGAYHCPRRDLWYSRIMVDGKDKFLGYFDSKEKAAEAYGQAAALLHGEFANIGD